jgi:2'-5' RNA ligase
LTLPEKDIVPLTQFQKEVAAAYDLFPEGKYPELHITLNKVPQKSAKLTTRIIKHLSYKTSPVEIKINNFTCFNDDFLVLNVEHTPSLKQLAAALHQNLQNFRLSTIENYQAWKFHITLISDLLSDNTIPRVDFKEMCAQLEGETEPIVTYAKKIELWRPTLDPNKKIIAFFPLN